MREETIRELLQDQWSSKPMKAITVRITEELYDEMRTFCGQVGIQQATVLRRCLREGWERINE